LVLTVALIGCAPVRDDAIGGIGGNSLQSAVYFQWGAETLDYTVAAIHLVGNDYGCEDALDLEVRWWALPADTDWVAISLLKGTNMGAWDQEFSSYFAFEQGNDWDYANAVYFLGTYGTGVADAGDDDDDELPPIGRDVQGYLGQDATQRDDTLEITSYSESLVVGVATGNRRTDGELQEYRFRFSATNCGIVNGGFDGGVGGGGGGGGGDPQ
jgi:hypothetical protein